MKLQLKALSIALGAATLMCGSAWGEASVGIQASSSSSAAVATARVNVTVSVPKFVFLRVGALSGSPQAMPFGIDAASILPYVVGTNNQPVTSGTIPSATFSASGAALTVQAYTNVAAGATFACTSSNPVGTNIQIASVANQPKLADFTVTAAGTSPAHPGGTSLACGSAGTLTGLTTYNGTWTYTLATPATPWASGDYGVQVAYTATTL
jgi:hypothetical protein